MALFGLDPGSIAGRVTASGAPARVPGLTESVVRGAVGFAVLSVVSFMPWVFGAGRRLGELGMYGACLVVFLVLCGPLLHRLIIGPGSLPRFTGLFGIAFVANAVAWTAAYMTLRGNLGSLAGLLAGTAAMGGIIAAAFDATTPAALKSMAALFVLNTLGYYAGWWVEVPVAKTHLKTAMLLYGLFYGLGLGAGLGLTFHFCQQAVRERLEPTASGSARK
jgi:hypothetical protein